MPEPEIATTTARPFVKWAGGKRQLLDTIDERLPEFIRHTGIIRRYVEPFVGGGAVFFHLMENYDVGEAFLYDINRELIVGYRAVQEDHAALIEKLNEIEKKYHPLPPSRQEAYYYRMRDRYNAQMSEFDFSRYNEEWIDRAAMLIFLNKTCYNGLFRQNLDGEFNVPFGRYENPTICDEENLTAVHYLLQNTKIICAHFKHSARRINEDTFVYFDPPYRPLNGTSGFTSYFKGDFTDKDQRDLATFYHKMDERGAALLLSNSDPKNVDPTDDFFDELYAGDSITIERVSARRQINSDGNGRGEIDELLVYNY